METDSETEKQRATVLGHGASININAGSSYKPSIWHIIIVGCEIIGLVLMGLILLTGGAHGH